MGSKMPTQLLVGAGESGLTLARFLAGRLSISAGRAKAVIDQRRVFVNGRRVWMARHRLARGDVITGEFEIEPVRNDLPIRVLHADTSYLIIDKPAGLTSNGPRSAEEVLGRGTPPRWIRACHRIDRDTSGCLLLALSVDARERAFALFARHAVRKRYEAIVRGRLERKNTIISAPIDNLPALSRVTVLDANPAASHVSITIETGRTHQIRKHLASVGHPVIGDKAYGGGGAVPPAERNVARQMLHAFEISFIHPFTGELVSCRADLPWDMADCLKQFRLH